MWEFHNKNWSTSADANDILLKSCYLSKCSRSIGESVKLGLMIKKNCQTRLMIASMTKSSPWGLIFLLLCCVVVPFILWWLLKIQVVLKCFYCLDFSSNFGCSLFSIFFSVVMQIDGFEYFKGKLPYRLEWILGVCG